MPVQSLREDSKVGQMCMLESAQENETARQSQSNTQTLTLSVEAIGELESGVAQSGLHFKKTFQASIGRMNWKAQNWGGEMIWEPLAEVKEKKY